jgi:hypothetical protein
MREETPDLRPAITSFDNVNIIVVVVVVVIKHLQHYQSQKRRRTRKTLTGFHSAADCCEVMLAGRINIAISIDCRSVKGRSKPIRTC